MNAIAANLNKISAKLPGSRRAQVIVGGAVLTLLLIFAVAIVRAGSPFISIQAEDATLTQLAQVKSDSQASGGQAVMFGNAVTTPTDPAPTTPETCNGPLNITTGGTYTGCYKSTNSNTPAITVSTTQPVTLNKVTVSHAGVGLDWRTARTNITIQNSTFTATTPSSTNPEQQAVRLLQPKTITITNNRFTNGHGVQITGDKVQTDVLQISYNDFIDAGRTSKSIYLQGAIHFDKVLAPGGKILWNRITSHRGQSWSEDVVALASTWGAAGKPIEVAHNLVNGAYPASGDGSGYTGGAYDFGDIEGGYITAHHNYAVNYTNNGFMIPSGTQIYVTDSLAVYDGLADDGQRVSSTFGTGFTTYHGSGYPPQNGIGMSNNRSAHRRWTGSTWEYANYYLPYGTNTNNTSFGTANSTAEQAAINEFEQSVTSNGVTIGPQ